ncbi:HD domain-containing phosphohydrolase [Methylococcus sp. EFPC2]|uniref:response regulator n=1 Tax=Methylococcus sp. EFPC2 TaxID=2812648 RepID=UPI001967C726|nr:HD domain-containing phosphohydrolase [Methylococcus sp. EFPC2]QSA98478.1 response regulator [Methylococcus sp. EFPC2]
MSHMHSVQPASHHNTADFERGPYGILLVDDDDQQIRLMRHILDDHSYQVLAANCGRDALACLEQADFDVILLDYNLPDMTGPEVCRAIRVRPSFKLMPIIMLTGRNGLSDVVDCLHAGANDFVAKPCSPMELEARVRGAAQRKRITDQLDDAESVLYTMAQMVEARDHGTGDHCARLAHLGALFGEALNLPFRERAALRHGAVLHDIGKIAVPDAILLKNGPLDEEEWVIMRKHPLIGAEICKRLHSMTLTLDIIRYHHERWDGRGYPDGLAGENIPYLARVFQILDVFDALISERPYKKGLPIAAALQMMRSETEEGKLDPSLVSAFMTLVEPITEWVKGAPWLMRHGRRADDSLREMLAGSRFAMR